MNDKKLSKNYDVVKRNILNQLCTEQYTLPELRLFAVYLSRIDTRDSSTNPASRKVRFSLDEFKDLTGLKRVCKSDILPSLKHLLSRQRIEESPDNTEENCKVKLFNLFSGAYFEKSQGGANFVEISATDEAIPYLFNIKREFVKYKLWNILQLTSKNQIRMYEILKQYLTIGRFECSIDRLKYLLGIPAEKYPDFRNLKRSVIDKCQEALKQHTDISFTYECGKLAARGKWEAIIFYIEPNTTSTGAEYEKSLRAYIDIEAETRAAVFSLDDLTGEQLPSVHAAGTPAGDPRTLEAERDLTGDELTPAGDPQSIYIKMAEKFDKTAEIITDNDLKEQFAEMAAEYRATERDNEYRERKRETCNCYGIEPSFSYNDTVGIVSLLQLKGYNDEKILPAFKRFLSLAKSKRPKNLKSYMETIIENHLPKYTDEIL